jgi:sulfate adenylyltransferase subunit 2
VAVAPKPNPPEPGQYELSHLRSLESEAVHIIREVAAEFERPVLLFSGGKDSIVMLHLALKAFAPARLPFPVMHVDTGHNFDEVIAARDELVSETGVRLLVASVQEDIDAGRVVDNGLSRNPLQTVTLLRGLRQNEFDAAFGGARRDEEKARAKERVFSFRDEFGQWDPKAQRPELWNLYNGRHRKGEHIRAFPISNWTEFDIWSYIGAEGINLPSIYYAHRRPVFQRDGMLLAVHRFLQPEPGSASSRRACGFAPSATSPAPAVWSPPPRPSRTSSLRPPFLGSPSAARRGPMTAFPKPEWKTASEKATSDDHLVAHRHRGIGRRRQIHADRTSAL